MKESDRPTEAKAYDVEQLRSDPISRRSFLARMGAAGLGLAATSLLGGTMLAGCGGGNNVVNPPGGVFPGIPGNSLIAQALNFALTLERLEADLYLQALNKACGFALNAPLLPITQSGQYQLAIGAGGVANVAAAFLYLKQFTYVEAAHRDFLIAAIPTIGDQPVGANPGGYQFVGGDPGSDLATILTNIVPLEETGVRAYLGALPSLGGNLELAQIAGTIYSTEARHSAAVRYILDPTSPGPSYAFQGAQLGGLEVSSPPPSEEAFEKFLAPADVLTAVQPFLVS